MILKLDSAIYIVMQRAVLRVGACVRTAVSVLYQGGESYRSAGKLGITPVLKNKIQDVPPSSVRALLVYFVSILDMGSRNKSYLTLSVSGRRKSNVAIQDVTPFGVLGEPK